MAEKHHKYAFEASVKYVDELTSNCDDIQVKVLNEILSQNADTEYLKRHGISNGCVDRNTFKSKVPIITYEDIKSDIQRICTEEFSPILCAKPISELWLSSGTTRGQPKLFPVTEDEKDRRNKLFTAVGPYIMGRIEGDNSYKGKTFGLLISRNESVTKSGITICAGTTSFFKNLSFYRDNPYPNNVNTSLREAILCPDHFQSMYTQLLCAFYQRHHVTRVISMFGSSLVWLIHFLRRHYSELCHDISSGTLSPLITDPALRAIMVQTFMHQPNPELGNFIETTCKEDNWQGIYTKIWPNLKYLDGILTGSMAQYIPMLDHYTGGLPLLSTKYSASECDLGYNLNPMCALRDVSYTIMPNMAYYEFIPLEPSFNSNSNSDSNPATVDLANVEVGKEYELVVTNYCGLYRYRLGDVLSPIGFYNSSPQFKFVRRKNVALSIDICKTTEVELQNAIDNAASLLLKAGAKVVEYTSYANMKKTPGHYVIYMELMSSGSSNLGANSVIHETMMQCCLTMEDSLGMLYKHCRAEDSVGPLEIRVVSNGTFDKVREYAISKGASFSQYKLPRCVQLLEILELLDTQVISSHFSPLQPPSTASLFSSQVGFSSPN
ncbi:hypothetical protein vseg_001534 [Gypsophila vaccaria]